MPYYVQEDSDGFIVCQILQDEAPEDGNLWHEHAERLDLRRANEHIRFLYNGGAPLPVDARELGEARANAIAKTYADVDRIYADAIGNRGTEYKEAADDSRAFAAAGFTGDVSEYVTSYAQHNPTGIAQTNQWAAEQIIARADAFLWAQKTMRTTRFARQGEMQAATTPADLTAAVAAWESFIAGLRAQLGL